MDWTEKKCLRLIELYQKYPVLWNPRDPNHKKKNLKEDAWNEIGNAMQLQPEVCKTKMIVLLSGFRREKMKTKKSRGKGSSEVYRSRWFAYDALGFLREALEGDNEETQNQTDEPGEVIQTKRPYPFSIQNAESITVPKPPKRVKIRNLKTESNNNNNLMTSAFQLLQTATAMMAPPSEDDEVTAFFKYVATKVKTYTSETRRRIQKAVFDLLMETDQGGNEWAPEKDDSTQFSLIPPISSPSQRSNDSVYSDDDQ